MSTNHLDFTCATVEGWGIRQTKTVLGLGKLRDLKEKWYLMALLWWLFLHPFFFTSLKWCVQLIFSKFILYWQKPLGLLSLLDEESTFPNGTDLTFANKLKQHLNSNPCFKGDRGKAFTVCHYAGEVCSSVINPNLYFNLPDLERKGEKQSCCPFISIM